VISLIVISIWTIYGPTWSRPYARLGIPIVLVFLVVEIVFLALANRLLFKMGFRNLIRHRGDSVIAIVGFMIGTAIVCSSLVIGDTLTDVVESIIYERYNLVDEVVYSQDQSGNLTMMNGSLADSISLALKEADDEGIIDGISFEIERSASVYDLTTDLLEPILTVRAFSPATTGVFGDLRSKGKVVPLPLENGTAALSHEAAVLLHASEGDTIMVSAGYSESTLRVAYILDDSGRANIFGGENVYLSLEAACSLFQLPYEAGSPAGDGGEWAGGTYNVLFISNRGGIVGGGKLCDEATPLIDAVMEGFPIGVSEPFEVKEDKGTGISEAMEDMDMSIKVFVSLSSFSIIAGITLIVNIFVMLSEERMEEMGISRAVGLKRSGLRLAYLFEGTMYSFLSSLMGVAVGVGAGWVIILILEKLVSSFRSGEGFDILSHYTLQPWTLIISFAVGFGITLGTTLFVTHRIARLNIVTAIRGTAPDRKLGPLRMALYALVLRCKPHEVKDLSCRLPRWGLTILDPAVIWAIAFALLGLGMTFMGAFARILWPVQIGVSLIIIGSAMLLRNAVPDRYAFTAAALVMLTWWLAPVPFTEGFQRDIEMFVFSGIFMVTAGVFLIVFNTDLILASSRWIFRILGASPAAFKMAISYPLKKRFRTGVTIFMFALIIFTITGLSMVVHLFNVNIAEFERSIGGGYEIVGISQIRQIPDLELTTSDLWGEENASMIDWERSSSLSFGLVNINVTLPGGGFLAEPYIITGVPDSFMRYTTYGFTSVDWDLLESKGVTGRSDNDVWEALRLPDIVIVDGFFGTNEFGPPGLGMEVGDTIAITTRNGTMMNKTIMAITDQFAIQSIFVDEHTASSEFNITEKKVHLLKVRPGSDAGEISEGMRRALVRYGFFTIVIKDLIKRVLSFQNNIFDLFNAYLSLGLVIGIVGLGVVTLRSVYERRHEIGMLRAIGFKKRAVVATFLGESSFIAMSGLLLGSILGILLGWSLWRDELREALPVFGIPYGRILLILTIAFIFALAGSIPPSNMASRVAPAEALRYE
jgi:putative ABC transport system permease protein